ncbi:hypothetical protein [Shewanella sp. 0m-4]
MKALVLLLVSALASNVDATERVNFEYWSVLKHEHHENSPYSATSVGFDVDREQRIWFTCAYNSDGFQAEFLKLKMTEYGQDIHTYVEYSNEHEHRKFYVAPSDIGTDLLTTINNLRFIEAVENWETMTIKYTIWQNSSIKSVTSRKINLVDYGKARSTAVSYCYQG